MFVGAIDVARITVAIWMPDSQHLVISARDRAAGHRFYMTSIHGEALEEIMRDGIAVSISRDGAWVYFYSYRSGKPELWKVRLATRRTAQVTASGGFYGIESEGGKTLHFSKPWRRVRWMSVHY